MTDERLDQILKQALAPEIAPAGSTAGRLSVALLLDLYYTGGWQKLLSSLLIYLSVCFADSWQNGKVQASR